MSVLSRHLKTLSAHPQVCRALDTVLPMCSDHVIPESTKTPRSLTHGDGSRMCPLFVVYVATSGKNGSCCRKESTLIRWLISSYFFSFKSILLDSAHRVTAVRSSCKRRQSATVDIFFPNLVSSANRLTMECLMQLGKSFTKIRNNSGPSTVP